jgi:selenocysteine lyase/cysteine desulfurase
VAEHNSVLRPLHHLQQQGLASVDFVPLDDHGVVAPAAVAARLRPETGFVILNHVSNVTGLIQPVAEIAAVCRRQKVPLFLDASQSAGVLPIDMQALGVSALAFTGHKSLLGPAGIGGLVLTAGVDPAPTRFGGTGFDSRSLAHPAAYPFRLEAGTLNILGILGLHAGLDYIAQAGRDAILTHERMLAARLITGLGAVPGVRVHYAASRAPRVGVVSCELENTVAEDAAEILDGEFRIAVRAGLHCAPLMHRQMGTERHGTLRFSVGPFTTLAEIEQAVTAVTQIAAA